MLADRLTPKKTGRNGKNAQVIRKVSGGREGMEWNGSGGDW